MGLIKSIFGNIIREPVVPVVINKQEIKLVESGTSGTQIYGGMLSEEYLSEQRGRIWADTIDKMRRSDANVRMAISAIKLPLKSGHWRISVKQEFDAKDPMALMQQKLIDKAVFQDLNMSFKKLIGEILTCLEFGYSLFDISFRPKMDDAEMGPYNTLKSIAYRSQRTIEYWNLDPETGELATVTQIVNGDLGTIAEMDAKYLLHFAPEQEGTNFEGMSILRAMYGCWLRKNHYLKLQAAGIEKYAIPIPILSVPAGKEASEEYTNAIAALQVYTSNQKNYLTVPEGWEIKVQEVNFDAEKIRATIDAENKEMANSILASFLLLGSSKGSSGNRALSEELSDFFAQTLQYIADHVAEQFGRKIFEPLVKMNFGNVPVMVELKCESLAEKADEQLATTLKLLTDGKLLTPDDSLEKDVREKFKLPEIDLLTRPAPPPVVAPMGVVPPPAPAGPPKQLSEKKLAQKKSPKIAKQRDEVPKLIKESKQSLKDFYRSQLGVIGADYIQKVIKAKNAANSATKAKAAINTDPSMPSHYLNGIKYLLAKSTHLAQKQVIDLVTKKKTLSEFRLSTGKEQNLQDKMDAADEALQNLIAAADSYTNSPSDDSLFSEFATARYRFNEAAESATDLLESDMSFSTTQRLSAKAELLAESQVADIKKNVALQYQSSYLSTDSDDILSTDLFEALDKYVDGPVSLVGPAILALQTINEARSDAGDEISDEVESYTFVNDDPVTAICTELDGRTFAPDDPDLARFTPPLHYNCDSYLIINLKSFNGNPEIDNDDLVLSKSAQKSINLSEPKTKCSNPTDEHSKFLISLGRSRLSPDLQKRLNS
jgi:hypothetical protein